MKSNKKILICIISGIILICLVVFIVLKNNTSNYKYEWIDVPESMIGQSRLYIVDKSGNHIDGKITITYLNGKSETVKISKDGTLYVKSIINKVENPRR